MIGSCSNALISSSIASLQRVTGRTLENRIKDARRKRHLARPAMCQQTQKLKPTFVQDQL